MGKHKNLTVTFIEKSDEEILNISSNIILELEDILKKNYEIEYRTNNINFGINLNTNYIFIDLSEYLNLIEPMVISNTVKRFIENDNIVISFNVLDQTDVLFNFDQNCEDKETLSCLTKNSIQYV